MLVPYLYNLNKMINYSYINACIEAGNTFIVLSMLEVLAHRVKHTHTHTFEDLH